MNVVELTQQLVGIDSQNPPGNEKKIAKFIKDYLDDLKIPNEIMEIEKNRFNVVGYLGKRNGLMLNGHMDTVPIGDPNRWRFDPFEGKVFRKRVYGRGTTDMKGGVAAMMIAAKNLAKEKFKRKLLLTFVADEEAFQKGSTYLIEKRKDLLKDVKYGIMGECTGLSARIAQKGVMDFKVIFKGKAAHGSKPELGDNAIYKASDFIQELRKLSKKFKKTRVLGQGTINIGVIKGGTKVNVVPDYCEVEVDRRLVPRETPQRAKRQVQKVLKKLKLDAKVEIPLKGRLPMVISKNSRIVRLIKSVTRTKTLAETGYTEAELFYRKGIQCVSFGPGVSRLAHMANEYVPIINLKRIARIYEGIIKKWCT